VTAPVWLGASAVHLPPDAVAVAELPEVLALPAAQRDHVRSLGIDEVRRVRGRDGRPGPDAEGELAARAAGDALARAGVAAEDLDALILVQGRAPQYLLASEATRLQARLGATRATTLGVGELGCVSVSAALDVAVALLRGRAAWRHVLVAMGAVAATPHRYRAPMTVLGDAGAAVLVTRDAGQWRWVDHAVRSDGRYADLFRIDYRDVPTDRWREVCADEPTYSFRLAMDSRSRLRDLNREVLEPHGVALDGLDAVLMQNLSRGAFAFWQGALHVKIADACAANLARYGHLGPVDVLANLATVAPTLGAGARVLVMNSSPVAAWSSMLLERGAAPR
jgi:3-oxoacyl-[acyl-carrier-protein] synthase III